MPYQNNIITQPVSYDDLHQALSTSENDLAALCTHDNINPWAVWKPFSIGEREDGLDWGPHYIRQANFKLRRAYGFGLKSLIIQDSLTNLVARLTTEIQNNTKLFRDGFVTWADKQDITTFRIHDFIDVTSTVRGYKSNAQRVGIGGIDYSSNIYAEMDFSNGAQNTETVNVDWLALDNVSESMVSHTEVNALDVFKYSVLGRGSFSTFNDYKRVVIVFGHGFIGYVAYPNPIPWTTWEPRMSSDLDNPSNWNTFYFVECMMSADSYNRITSTSPTFNILPALCNSFRVRFKYGVKIFGIADPVYTSWTSWHWSYNTMSVRLQGVKFSDIRYFTFECCYYFKNTNRLEVISSDRVYRYDQFSSLDTDVLPVPDYENNDGYITGTDIQFAIRFTHYSDSSLTSIKRRVSVSIDTLEVLDV